MKIHNAPLISSVLESKEILGQYYSISAIGGITVIRKFFEFLWKYRTQYFKKNNTWKNIENLEKIQKYIQELENLSTKRLMVEVLFFTWTGFKLVSYDEIILLLAFSSPFTAIQYYRRGRYALEILDKKFIYLKKFQRKSRRVFNFSICLAGYVIFALLATGIFFIGIYTKNIGLSTRLFFIFYLCPSLAWIAFLFMDFGTPLIRAKKILQLQDTVAGDSKDFTPPASQ